MTFARLANMLGGFRKGGAITPTGQRQPPINKNSAGVATACFACHSRQTRLGTANITCTQSLPCTHTESVAQSAGPNSTRCVKSSAVLLSLPPVEEAAAAVEHVPQLVCVGEVAVVDEVDAQGAVHKEGLGLLGR